MRGAIGSEHRELLQLDQLAASPCAPAPAAPGIPPRENGRPRPCPAPRRGRPSPVMTKFASVPALGILGIVEIDHRRALRRCRRRWRRRDLAAARPSACCGPSSTQAVVQRNPGAGDRRRARAAVGLDDVAIQRDLPLAERRRSTTARSERPISRWISCVRPLWRPAELRAACARCVARGSIEYSAVTQPLPVLRSQAGGLSSTEAVQSTCVSPNFTRHEPSA